MRLIFGLLVFYVAGYAAGFYFFGMHWDPNGKHFNQKPLAELVKIALDGLLVSPRLAVDTFMAGTAPMPKLLGGGFAACALLALIGYREVTGRRVLYTLSALLAVMGALRFCLDK